MSTAAAAAANSSPKQRSQNRFLNRKIHHDNHHHHDHHPVPDETRDQELEESVFLNKPQSRKPRKRQTKRPSTDPTPWSNDPHIRMAVYVAMAHAGLALSLGLLYGVTKLLQGYWRPIQWAILCSMPLRELHTALVAFWSHSLQLGLFETIIAIPIAVLRAVTASLIDSHAAVLQLARHPAARRSRKIGFRKLMQWLVSFGLFVLVSERIGLFSIPAIAIPCFVAYKTGFGAIINPGVASTLSKISFARHNSKKFSRNISCFSKLGGYITSMMLNRLKTAVGIGLILLLILGSAFGFFFFSYKIAIEGKEAVVSLEMHLKANNYAERIGLQKWIDENQIPELIDAWTAKFYVTLSQNIDSLAMHYNMTEIVDGVKKYLSRSSTHSSVTSVVHDHVRFRTLSEKFHRIQTRVRKGEWKLLYRDIDDEIRELKGLIAREDLVEKIKAFVLQSLYVSKQVLSSGSMVLIGGANLLFFLVLSIVSGAAGLLNFISELLVFSWLLYYLITSDSGGVMDHVLGMLPLSRMTRNRCAQVLDHAISSVLLASAKLTFFHGCLTYFLFRFYRIHFLYMSTFLAVLSGALPVVPSWLASTPAAAQMAMEARYIEAVLLMSIHLLLLDYGTATMQIDIPGQNAYLTGLSMLGGVALFPSVVEGAIMGPLLMTVMIALKNLYVEFVLTPANETS